MATPRLILPSSRPSAIRAGLVGSALCKKLLAQAKNPVRRELTLFNYAVEVAADPRTKSGLVRVTPPTYYYATDGIPAILLYDGVKYRTGRPYPSFSLNAPTEANKAPSVTFSSGLISSGGETARTEEITQDEYDWLVVADKHPDATWLETTARYTNAEAVSWHVATEKIMGVVASVGHIWEDYIEKERALIFSPWGMRTAVEFLNRYTGYAWETWQIPFTPTNNAAMVWHRTGEGTLEVVTFHRVPSAEDPTTLIEVGFHDTISVGSRLSSVRADPNEDGSIKLVYAFWTDTRGVAVSGPDKGTVTKVIERTYTPSETGVSVGVLEKTPCNWQVQVDTTYISHSIDMNVFANGSQRASANWRMFNGEAHGYSIWESRREYSEVSEHVFKLHIGAHVLTLGGYVDNFTSYVGVRVDVTTGFQSQTRVPYSYLDYITSTYEYLVEGSTVYTHAAKMALSTGELVDLTEATGGLGGYLGRFTDLIAAAETECLIRVLWYRVVKEEGYTTYKVFHITKHFSIDPRTGAVKTLLADTSETLSPSSFDVYGARIYVYAGAGDSLPVKLKAIHTDSGGLAYFWVKNGERTLSFNGVDIPVVFSEDSIALNSAWEFNPVHSKEKEGVPTEFHATVYVDWFNPQRYMLTAKITRQPDGSLLATAIIEDMPGYTT